MNRDGKEESETPNADELLEKYADFINEDL